MIVIFNAGDVLTVYMMIVILAHSKHDDHHIEE